MLYYGAQLTCRHGIRCFCTKLLLNIDCCVCLIVKNGLNWSGASKILYCHWKSLPCISFNTKYCLLSMFFVRYNILTLSRRLNLGWWDYPKFNVLESVSMLYRTKNIDMNIFSRYAIAYLHLCKHLPFCKSTSS